MSWPISTSTSITVALGSTIVDPGEHVTLVDAPLGVGGDRGERDPVVDPDASRLGRRSRGRATVRSWERRIGSTSGQVLLALGVVLAAPARAPGQQRAALEGEDPGIDLADVELEIGRVARAPWSRPHARPSRRARARPGRSRRGRRARRWPSSRRRPDRSCASASSRIVSGVISGTSPARTITVASGSMYSAAALTASAVPRGSCWTATTAVPSSDASSAPVGAVDDHDPPRARRARRRDRPAEHRPPTQCVQQLGSRGAHARALPRGEDDNNGRGHVERIVGDPPPRDTAPTLMACATGPAATGWESGRRRAVACRPGIPWLG